MADIVLRSVKGTSLTFAEGDANISNINDEISIDNYPNIRPTLNLDFAKSKSLGSKITFSRASTASYFDNLGVLKTTAIDEPRFSHDPYTGESLGLLVEPTATNLITYSENFTHADWLAVNSSIAQTITLSPNDIPIIGKLVENTDNTTHAIKRNTGKLATITAGANIVGSLYIKADERTKGRLLISNVDNSVSFYADFDLTLGTIEDTSIGVGTPTNLLSGIKRITQEFYHIWISGTMDVSSTSADLQISLRDDSGSTTYIGDGTSGFYIWGAQVETGTKPTSYIKTESTQVTRAADSVEISGTNFSSWYNQIEGTLITETYHEIPVIGTTPRYYASINSNNSSNKIESRSNEDGTGFGTTVVVDSVTLLEESIGGRVSSDFNKHSIAYKSGSIIQAGNGVLGVEDTDTFVTIPATRMDIGANNSIIGSTDTQISGYIKSISYYPKRLTNTQLQLLTS